MNVIDQNTMKIILSRKGFDSGYGAMPSPILPDGTLLSMPIPAKDDSVKFDDLHYNGQSYYRDIIKSLKPTTKITENYTCHLDPDIRRDVVERPDGWKPAFGQEKAALSHLRNQGVGIGSLFLFFGWFRQTEYRDGRLFYVKGAPDLHVIYGWMQVGQIIDNSAGVPEWLSAHPHNAPAYWQRPERKKKPSNAIYVAGDRLSIMPELPGAGCLHFSDRLVLTKKGSKKRSVWDLPDFMRDIPITYNAKAWKEEGFVSASKGQEFVFDANDDVISWIKDMLISGR